MRIKAVDKIKGVVEIGPGTVRPHLVEACPVCIESSIPVLRVGHIGRLVNKAGHIRPLILVKGQAVLDGTVVPENGIQLVRLVDAFADFGIIQRFLFLQENDRLLGSIFLCICSRIQDHHARLIGIWLHNHHTRILRLCLDNQHAARFH